MLQQLIALFIIVFFLYRLAVQKRKNQITKNEFSFWIIFWLLASLAIIFIKVIDRAVAVIGFSGSGINFLLYLSVMILFYFIFRLRLKIVKLESDLTKVVREVALKK